MVDCLVPSKFEIIPGLLGIVRRVKIDFLSGETTTSVAWSDKSIVFRL